MARRGPWGSGVMARGWSSALHPRPLCLIHALVRDTLHRRYKVIPSICTIFFQNWMFSDWIRGTYLEGMAIMGLVPASDNYKAKGYETKGQPVQKGRCVPLTALAFGNVSRQQLKWVISDLHETQCPVPVHIGLALMEVSAKWTE